MKTTASIDELRRQIAKWRREGARVGFVPTMGNLHAGHLELVRHASSRAQRVVVSVFVNPMQFCPGEDFDSYPRTLRKDQEKLEHEQVDVLFTPCVETIYPRGVEASTRIEVPQVSEGMCGDFRPGHFTGVATVVACLFNLVQPQLAVFGEKDYQQLAVIRRMVGDLCWDIEIEGVPTVREADGLAMSSRNQYLTETERKRAPALYRTLCQVAERLRAQDSSYRDLEMAAMADLEKAGFSPEYVNIRHAETLLPAEIGETRCVVLAAARLGDTRLIDNVKV
jgi:pantoate--beta-alanine ligase